MKIGYSCWGFLGDGVIDTPDGGRSHRLTLINELIQNNCHIIMLQKNRDLEEAYENFATNKIIFESGFPEIDALFLEYRWKIPGRNCELTKDDVKYTPDLDRQNELLAHYLTKNIPILIWDKDQKLDETEFRKIAIKNVFVFEACLNPRIGRNTLLFPNSIEQTSKALSLVAGYSKNRQYKLVYIGSQYERDSTFKKYIDGTAAILNTKATVFGKWPHIIDSSVGAFNNCNFLGRIGYKDVPNIYTNSFSTVLIAPDRYYAGGQYTQRLFESLWGLCIPLIPQEYNCKFLPDKLIVNSSQDVANKINELYESTSEDIKELLVATLGALDIFSPKKQVSKILNVIKT